MRWTSSQPGETDAVTARWVVMSMWSDLRAGMSSRVTTHTLCEGFLDAGSIIRPNSGQPWDSCLRWPPPKRGVVVFRFLTARRVARPGLAHHR